MRFVHTKCGGEVDTKKRKCSKCKRKWNPISILITTELRPMVDRKRRLVPDRKVTYAKWADRIPGAGQVAGFLPNWPRWARILATVIVVIIVVVIILLVRGHSGY